MYFCPEPKLEQMNELQPLKFRVRVRKEATERELLEACGAVLGVDPNYLVLREVFQKKYVREVCIRGIQPRPYLFHSFFYFVSC